MKLRRNNPTVFCKDFIDRELESYKEKSIWKSYWPVMQRMIDRADELTLAFDEIVSKFGYSDKVEGYPPENAYVWLILEHIWGSKGYCREDIKNARDNLKELCSLSEEITNLSEQLAAALRRQAELYEYAGFQRQDCQSVIGMIEKASEHNHLYNSYLSKPLNSLAGQYDLKYWPSRAEAVEAIANFERVQPSPVHYEIPDQVMQGRISDIKDFVITFDLKFDDDWSNLPKEFRFSNNAMAEIINVVLDLPNDTLKTGEAVRLVRNRHSNILVSSQQPKEAQRLS